MDAKSPPLPLPLTAAIDAAKTKYLFVEWDRSQTVWPEMREFFTPKRVERACLWAGLDEPMLPHARRAAERIRENENLFALSAHLHYALHHSETYPRDVFRDWPALQPVLGPDAGLFYLLTLLSGQPHTSTIYQKRNIPRDVLANTMSDVVFRSRAYRSRTGEWGLTPRDVGWFVKHFKGEMFQLARLQFIPGPFKGRLVAFRHRPSSVVVALSEDGVPFRADGQVDGTGGEHDIAGGWTASLKWTRTYVAGHVILPEGHAIPTRANLPLDRWEKVLARDDPMLHIHIPSGVPLDFEGCGQAFETAGPFYETYFPEVEFHGFICSSWLLNTQMEGWLPPTSNIVRFQREPYLYPKLSGGESTLRRVFGENVPTDWSKAPRDTALRRAIADHLLAGHHLRGGCFFLLKDDIRWGTQVYRSQRLPGILERLAANPDFDRNVSK